VSIGLLPVATIHLQKFSPHKQRAAAAIKGGIPQYEKDKNPVRKTLLKFSV
jgi:hypothetical protein